MCGALPSFLFITVQRLFFFFFFSSRRRHTRCHGDWSSDVCSSDLLKGEPLEVHGDGAQSRDFTYIDNVVHANLLALEAKNVGGKMMNIGSGRRFSLNQLVHMLE